jgi:glycosyltransferase involved in cell wall biosynthesis
VNSLGLGGTEKAAIFWAGALAARGHSVSLASLADGPRRVEAEAHGLPLHIVPDDAAVLAKLIQGVGPDVIHAHAPGFPHQGDILGGALHTCKGVPVVQTNIFGRLENPSENRWVSMRLFISWTSCVQAAQRSFLRLDRAFFARNSVAVYPVSPEEPLNPSVVAAFRSSLGLSPEVVLLGRLSRPEPNKWTDLPLRAFRKAHASNPTLRFLLREPPPHVAQRIASEPESEIFVLLPATGDSTEIKLTLSALDIALHTSSIGESFGYGIAEPMNLGKPVITNSTPWQDQAQLELVEHGSTGFHASTTDTMADAILKLANDVDLRTTMGRTGAERIRALADPQESVSRVESALMAAIDGRQNPNVEEDLLKARQTARNLHIHRFGHSAAEWWALAPFYHRARLHQFRMWMMQVLDRLRSSPSCRRRAPALN